LKKYIIDANIFFSAIISAKRTYLDLTKNVDLYAPDFVLKEIEKYEELLLKKAKIPKKELNSFLIKLFKEITILPSIMISKESKQKAIELCRDIDPKDSPYIALALEMDIPFITNDKKLYNGLRKKGFPHLILLEDVINSIKNIGN